jgi:hypothetical protein
MKPCASKIAFALNYNVTSAASPTVGFFEPILPRNHAAGTARPRAFDRSGRI